MKKRRKFVAAEVFEPLDALSTNRDRTKVAVTGRTVTKVYAIHDDHFELRTDRSKPRKTMYFSGSIAWSPLRENLIAAASSNGAIYLWDPESPQSMECSYKAHKQMATKVCFSEFNENILVSGSKDSTVWLYDLRTPEPSTCFASNQDDSIRDIQFCMESKMQETFVTAGDSGTIRFWDSRRPDRALKEFIAHSSQVYSIALNPQVQSKNLIATAGRDKYIRIWDWSKNTPQFLYTVEMMAIVTRVSWCPDNSWHVSCCFAPPSGFVSSDNTIYVWDIRRPFIPFASFDAHARTCTDMSWPRHGGGASTFLSCGKDGKLIMNFTESADRPIVYANSVALDTNTSFNDEIVVAVPAYRRKCSSALVDSGASADPFRRKVPSDLFSITPTDPFHMDGRMLAYFGQNYKIVGVSLAEMCEHNARVAESIYKDKLAYTWRMIALLCARTDLCNNTNSNSGKQRPHFLLDSSNNYAFDSADENSAGLMMARNRLGGGGVGNSAREQQQNGGSKEGSSNGMTNGTGGGAGGRRSTAVLISGSLTVQQNSAQHNANMDLFFGADELNLGGMSGDSEEREMRASRRSIVSSSDIVTLAHLKEEAFELIRSSRHRPSRPKNGRKLPQQQENKQQNRRQKLSFCGMNPSSSAATTAATIRTFVGSFVGEEDEDKEEREAGGGGGGEGATASFDAEVRGAATSASTAGGSSSADGSSNSNGNDDDEEDDGGDEDNDDEEDDEDGLGMEQEEEECCEMMMINAVASGPDDNDGDDDGRGGIGGGSRTKILVDDAFLQRQHSVGNGEQQRYMATTTTMTTTFSGGSNNNNLLFPRYQQHQSQQQQNGFSLKQQQQSPLEQFDPMPLLKSLLEFHSNSGDVQMCATMCCVIGERLLDYQLVSANQAELWFFAYLELLERLKLWRVSSLLIKCCFRSKISQLSNESTFVKTYCRCCRSTAARAQMRCAKCRQLYNYTCTICEVTVRGIWSSCAECGHGGHLAHMDQWFGQSLVCPAIGCGHQCGGARNAKMR